MIRHKAHGSRNWAHNALDLFTRPISELIPWLPAMLIITAAGSITGLAAIALLPFTGRRDLGKQLANVAIAVGILSSLFFFGVFGSQMPRSGRVFLMVPAFLGLAARIIYPKDIPEARGFDVLVPKIEDNEESSETK